MEGGGVEGGGEMGGFSGTDGILIFTDRVLLKCFFLLLKNNAQLLIKL
jgi:hypothetical protein